MLKKLYLSLTLLTAFLWLGSGTMWGATLTVAETPTTTSDCIPLYGYYGDTGGTNSQVIYSKDFLGNLAGGTITAMKFYASTSTASWTGTWAVSLAEVSNSSLSGIITPASSTEVYRGTLSISSNEMTITFSTPFEYSGENNLLVGIALTKTGNCPEASFRGIAATGAGWCSKKYSAQNVLPKVTFTYTPGAPETCAKPTVLTKGTVTSSTASYSWTDDTNSQWQYLCLPSATTLTDDHWTGVEPTSNKTATVENLMPNKTKYKFYVRAYCSSSDQSKVLNDEFETECGIISIPVEGWTYGFESDETGSGKIPSCWTAKQYGTYTKYPYVYSGNAHNSSTKCLYFSGGSSSSPQSIILPELNEDLKDLTLSFYYNNQTTDTDYPCLTVGYYDTDGDYSTTFHSIGDPLPVKNGYTLAEFDLKDVPTTHKHIVINYAGSGYYSHAVYVDDIKLIRTPNCLKPSSLGYSSPTTHGVTLSWTAGASETAWNVRYMADGDADWTVIPADDNDGFTVSGLSDNTHYTMQVQADCGSEVVSEWNSTAIDFTTKCNAFAMPFTQTFNDLTAGIPDCWDNSEGTTEEAAYKWNYNASGYNGACVRFEALYNPTDKDNYLKTPSITVSEAAQLSFRYKNPKGAALSVYYSIDGGEKVAWLTSLETKTTWSDLVVEDLPAACEGHSVVIMFKGVSNCSYGDAYIYLDEVQVKAKPSCITPTGLGYSAVTAEGATLSWTAGASETAWKVQYSEDNSTWSEAVDATSNPFVLTGLNDNTLYYVRVAANCGESESDYTNATVSFTTKCATITSFPWSEDFQGETNETNIVCWDNSASTCFTNPAGMTPSKYVWGVIQTGSYGDYNYQLYMRNYNVRAGTALINTPSFTLPSDKDMQLVFNYSHLASCDPLVVKVSVNGGEFSAIDGASYSNDPAGTYSYSNPGTYKEATIDLSAHRGKTIILQFFTTANYGEGAIWLDNVRIEAAPSCFKPQNLSAASSITPDGATFSWEASGHGETTYQWAVAAGSDAPVWEDNAAHKTSELTKTVTGLAAGTYKFYVRSYCDSEDQSDAAVSASFTTATVAAPTIGDITTTNTTAHATWTAPSVSYSVQYQWKTSKAGSAWSAATSDLSAAISGLDANTTYTFYVRSYYDASHIGLEVTKSFTTECNAITVSAVEYAETFDDISSGIPSCWKNSEGTTTNDSYKWNSAASGQSGRCVRFNSKNNGTDKTNILASPLFTITSDADLTFFVKNYKGGAYDVKISVNGGERQTLFTGLTNIQNWTKKEAALTDHIGKTVQFFFCATSNYSESNDGYLYLDEFKITPVSCRKPASDPVVDSKDDTHATISWTAGGASNYQFCLAPAGTAVGDLVWDAANVVSTLSKSFDDLSPLTSYDFYVRTYCDEFNQSDARKVSFKTDCAGFVTLPFEENFNGLADVTTPECWDNSEGSITDGYKKWRSRGNNYLCFNSSTTDAGETSILATPTIQLGEGNLLTFKTKNPTGGAFKVQIKEEGEDAVDLITGLTGIADWTLKYVAIPAAYNNKKVQLLFHATSNEGDANAYIYIDDVRVARGEAFEDGNNTGVETRLGDLNDQTIDFVMTRPMQYNGFYNTLCLPFAVSAADMAESDHPFYNCTLKAFDYAVVTAEELQLAIVGASSINAGVPYFVRYDGAATADKTALLFKEVTISTSTPENKEDNNVTYSGIFNTITATAESEEDHAPACLFVGGENQLYWPTTDRKMNAFRAYFSIVYGGGAGAPIKRGMSARLVERPNAPTGVDNVQDNDVQSVKVLENNQVIIIRNGVKYSVQGQKIQ